MAAPFNEFAQALVNREMPVAVANAFAKGFEIGTPEQRDLIIEELDMSHALVALALYGRKF